ncbi:MAG TPA: RT0821/Lpp0805 family surface protein [Alphaproteobacteria bacterium]|nr:RT0821/Lpp0805 family surface protein [Alphaproteobacteria bacterium]
MMRKSVLAAVAASTLALGACQQGAGGFGGVGTKQTIGGLGGAVAGGLAGSQIGGGTGRLVATGIGAALGGLLGSEVGKSLDRADQGYLGNTTQQALETGQTNSSYQWRNPDSGNSGTVTPVRTYEQPGGQVCREFQQTVFVGGRSEAATGTACRQPDGTWKIVG